MIVIGCFLISFHNPLCEQNMFRRRRDTKLVEALMRKVSYSSLSAARQCSALPTSTDVCDPAPCMLAVVRLLPCAQRGGRSGGKKGGKKKKG